MKLKCLIIDDEPDAVRLLGKVLGDFCADKAEVVGFTSSSAEGMKLISKMDFDLLFLDIEMPGTSGFDLMDLQEQPTFRTVFVTAYDKHALKAIKYKPDGYLLKPIDIGELIATVDIIHREKFNKAEVRVPVTGKYSISLKEETLLVDFAEILFIKADGRYSDVCLNDQRTIRVCKNIGSFERELVKKGFVRCHKSYLVNPTHIVRLNKTDGGFIEISNGTHIEISRRKRHIMFSQVS